MSDAVCISSKAFKHGSDTYLAVATELSGSMIMKHDGFTFRTVKSLSSAEYGEIRAWETFVQGEDTYIIATVFRKNVDATMNYDVDSWVFKLGSDGSTVDEVMRLPTQGAKSCTTFVSDGVRYVAFANHRSNNRKTDIASSIYQINVMSSVPSFSMHQAIHNTTWANDVTSFKIKNEQYLAFANYLSEPYGATGFQKFAAHSTVYKLQASGFFGGEKKLKTNGASGITAFEIEGSTYLAVANNLRLADMEGTIQKYNNAQSREAPSGSVSVTLLELTDQLEVVYDFSTTPGSSGKIHVHAGSKCSDTISDHYTEWISDETGRASGSFIVSTIDTQFGGSLGHGIMVGNLCCIPWSFLYRFNTVLTNGI